MGKKGKLKKTPFVPICLEVVIFFKKKFLVAFGLQAIFTHFHIYSCSFP